MQAKASTSGDEQFAIVERIGQLGQASVGRGDHIEFGGAFHIEPLMRQFGIELANEIIEAFLLLRAVGAVAAETRTKGMAENLSIRLLDQPNFLIQAHGFVFDLQSCNLHDRK